MAQLLLQQPSTKAHSGSSSSGVTVLKSSVRRRSQPTQSQSTLAERAATESGTTQTDNGRRVTGFVAMPFAKGTERLYKAIRQAALDAGITPLRADEILKPGPIVNQIFDALATSDCVIAEVGSRNPNVYYELALAHCVQKPSVLIARKDSTEQIPFDIRHNRIIVYADRDLAGLTKKLARSLSFVKDSLINGNTTSTFEDHMAGLWPGRSAEAVVRDLIKQVGAEFQLVNPKLQEQSAIEGGGYSVRISDDLGDAVAFAVDVNGIVRRKKRLRVD